MMDGGFQKKLYQKKLKKEKKTARPKNHLFFYFFKDVQPQGRKM